jgi:hypothetical protein
MSLITGTIVIAQATGQTEVASRNKAVAQTLLEQKQLRRLYIPKRKVSHH